MYSFSLCNIYWKYKKNKNPTIKNINFNVCHGDFHAFIGENGAGKSTTIRLIVGLSNNYDGDLFINDRNAKSDIYARNGLCYIPDKAVFPNNMSTLKYLYYSINLIRNDKNQIKKEIDSYLETYGIQEIRNRNPNKLSAGQKRKILLIRAILEGANIVILDEPAANLDPTTRIQFFEELKKLNKIGVTIFLSTHILEEIKKYANSATFIKGGEILWSGKVQDNEIVEKYEEMFL